MVIYEKFTSPTFDENGRIVDIKIKAPANFNFGYDVIDAIAKKQPDKTALVWCNELGEEATFTFGDLKKLSNKTANFLTEHGVKQGDRVILIMGRAWQYWTTVIALHKIGCIAIPCSNQQNAKDIIYRVQKAKAKHIIINGEATVREQVRHAKTKTQIFCVNGDGDGFINLDTGIKKAKSSLKRVATLAQDDMLAYFTSGTTGMPKCAMHNYLYPLGHIPTARYWHQLTPESLHLTVSDSGWAKCGWGKIYGQWLCEAAIFVYDFAKFSPSSMTAVIKKYNVTSFCAPPTIYRFFAKEGINKSDFEHVKHATTAGEPLNSEIFALFKKVTGLSIMEGFGQSETTCVIGFFTGDVPVHESMGRANPLYDIRLLTDDDKEAAPGEIGEICVNINYNKVGIVDRYLDDKEANKSQFRGGFYHTGDLARRDENKLFYYVGRKDDIIKSSGYRIGPFEIESVLIEHPAVRECAVLGVDDEVRGTIIKACVVLTSSFEPSDTLRKELQEFVKTNTAPYKYPRILEFYKELPKTPSGKVKRTELR